MSCRAIPMEAAKRASELQGPDVSWSQVAKILGYHPVSLRGAALRYRNGTFTGIREDQLRRRAKALALIQSGCDPDVVVTQSGLADKTAETMLYEAGLSLRLMRRDSPERLEKIRRDAEAQARDTARPIEEHMAMLRARRMRQERLSRGGQS